MDAENSPSPPDSQLLFGLKKLPGEPDHCRLTSAARVRANQFESRTTPSLAHFWFRTRYISALGSRISHLHPHVLGLEILPSRVANFIRTFTGLLPAFFRSRVQAIIPEWFLPDHVVLKQEKGGNFKKSIAQERFDAEAGAYNRLKPLQGVLVPTCYGRVFCNGARGLILEHIGGVSLSSPEGATFRLEELPALLEPCYRTLSALGACHGDPNLSNFQFVDGKMRVLDLEDVEFGLCGDDLLQFMKTNIWDVAYRYRSV